jgi:hypothetical protein
MIDRRTINRLYQDIKSGKINPTNIVNIIKAVSKYAKGDSEASMEILELVARGPDGIQGTEDDIPQSTLVVLRAVLQTGIVPDLIAELSKKNWCCF